MQTNLTQDKIRSLLNFDPDTGMLSWISGQRKGLPAGHARKDGYIGIMICQKSYLAHRIAWLHANGEFPQEIDHINKVRSDNRLANLRAASHSQNQHNRSAYSNNTSGFKGVSWHKGHQKWAARIRVDSILKHLGYFATKEDAYTAYCKAASTDHKEFCRVI